MANLIHNGSGASNESGPVIFILDRLPLVNEDDFYSPDVPQAQPREIRAATYQRLIKLIPESPLNQAGMVQSIYVNFGTNGYFHINSNFIRSMGPRLFEDVLGVGILLSESYAGIPNITASLPPNTLIIGCRCGAHQDANPINYRDYIASAPTNRPLAFVVGDFANTEVAAIVNHHVKVADVELEAATCLSLVVMELEKKLNIH